MPGRPHATRAQRASMRCEWKTKRPSLAYLHLSDNQLKKEIGEIYGFKHLAVGRATVNHAKDNLDSDDEHCFICRARTKNNEARNANSELDEQGGAKTQTGSSTSEPVKEKGISKDLKASPRNTGPSGATSSLHDAIPVHSSEDENSESAIPKKRSKRFASPNRSPTKRSRMWVSESDDDGERDGGGNAPSSLGETSKPQKPPTYHSEVSNAPEIFQFLEAVSPSYTRYAPALVDLGISTLDRLMDVQSMNPAAHETLLSRMEKRGVPASACAKIELAISQL
ncbi:hypothetical protein K439DRAFT_1627207 [Ramaria rubella]|nr:hypothetical protein K439DRAFT_1627207 [Ramaria rubella]